MYVGPSSLISFATRDPRPALMFWAILNLLDQCKAGAKDNKIPLASVRVHHKYATHDPFYDIAVVKLAKKVPNTPACLPTSKFNISLHRS